MKCLKCNTLFDPFSESCNCPKIYCVILIQPQPFDIHETSWSIGSEGFFNSGGGHESYYCVVEANNKHEASIYALVKRKQYLIKYNEENKNVPGKLWLDPYYFDVKHKDRIIDDRTVELYGWKP